MTPRDQLLERFTGGAAAAQAAVFQYETRYVARTLALLRLPKRVSRALLDSEVQATGQARLTFRAFNEMFESFPFHLGCDPLMGVRPHLSPACLIPGLFRDFSDTPFFVAYSAFCLSAPGSKRELGLIVPFKGIRGGLFVHQTAAAGFPYEGTTLTHELKDEDGWRCVHVRKYVNVLEAIYNHGHGWKPDQ